MKQRSRHDYGRDYTTGYVTKKLQAPRLAQLRNDQARLDLLLWHIPLALGTLAL